MFQATAIRIKDEAGIREGFVYLTYVIGGAGARSGWAMREDVARQEYHLDLIVDEHHAIDSTTGKIVDISPSDKRYKLM